MLENTIQRAQWHVDTKFPRNRDCSGPYRVLKLPVASLSPDMVPPVLFEKPDHFADLHVTLCIGIGLDNLPLLLESQPVAVSFCSEKDREIGEQQQDAPTT